MRLFNFCLTHDYKLDPENTWTHYWLIIGTSRWYEYSRGMKTCIYCNKKKEFEYKLPHFPYNDGSTNIFLK